MWQSPKATTNVHDRVAALDFMEQMREFYGLTPKYNKKTKNLRRSVLDKIEYQLSKLRDEAAQNELKQLLGAPFDKEQTPLRYNAIMSKLYKGQIQQHYEYNRSTN